MSAFTADTPTQSDNHAQPKQGSQLTWVEIDLAALDSNINYLKQRAANAELIMVIKANAYGHGISELAQHLETNNKVNALAVARLDEALQLRAQGIQKRIIILSGCINLSDFQLCSEYDLEAVIHNTLSAEIWANLLQQQLNQADNNICKAWIKINTGMNRLGLNGNDFLNFIQQLKKILQSHHLTNSNLLQGVLSHFSSSEDLQSPKNDQQKTLFTSLIDSSALNSYFPNALHCLANSAGIIYHQDSHHCAVRTGISAYGLPPGISDSDTQPLKPVMRFKSTIIAIQTLEKGESVGYNGLFTAQQTVKLATVAVGYGDGYPRNAPGKAQVYILGQKAPIAGRVSMDLISVDITHINASINDEVELWGDNIACEELATLCDTISYQLITGISHRVARIYQR